MRTILAIALAMSLSACEQPYQAPILYQAQSPDCRDWTDGSRFALPKDIDVFAGTPKGSHAEYVQLQISYFIPRGKSVTFASADFLLTEPKGRAIAMGVIEHIETGVRDGPGLPTEPLPKLPTTLSAVDRGEETMFRITLRFASPPDRFDLAHPTMVVDGTEYPVRTYTYRWFEQRKAYGLCS